ncbi:hypothetical protein K438DRAFT_2123671 [Mycena galopus ATCC 62051]|nr:hypothetical protein K438DRAFT_2123671 [Mycena galopus ATCC 62051]
MALSSLESVYYLSVFAGFLQQTRKDDVENSVAESLHSSGTDSETTSRGRLANHLSTLFTRGRVKGDISRTVAVAAGSLLLDKMSILVSTSSTSIPSTSPTISPSATTSAIGDETDAGSPPPNISAQDPLNRILLSRNSGADNNGSVKHEIIPADEDFDCVLTRTTKVNSKAFEEYVSLSLHLLRSGAARMRASSSQSRASVMASAMRFFVGACFLKIQARFNTFQKIYPTDALGRDWGPFDSEILPLSEVKITHPAIQKLLIKAKTPNGTFLLDSSNVMLWWGGLIQLLRGMAKFISALKGDDRIDKVASMSETIHSFLKEIPLAFWSIPLLVGHLRKCRSSGPQNEEISGEEEDAEEAFGTGQYESSIISNSALIPVNAAQQIISNAPPEVRAFYRCIDAVCAWTTGSKYILSSGIAKSKAPLSLSIVNLPREDVPEHSVEVLAARWMERGRWTPSTHQIVTESLRSFQADAQEKEAETTRRATSGTATTEDAVEISATPIPSTTGACHCEAELIASILLRQLQLEPRNLEPAVLTDAFADLDVAKDSFTIGVAKKCCPTCKILIDILRTDNRFKVNIAGAHSRFNLWVPPKWLPLKVLDQMEAKLLNVVKNMVTEHNFSGSRASSPASDHRNDDDLDRRGYVYFIVKQLKAPDHRANEILLCDSPPCGSPIQTKAHRVAAVFSVPELRRAASTPVAHTRTAPSPRPRLIPLDKHSAIGVASPRTLSAVLAVGSAAQPPSPSSLRAQATRDRDGQQRQPGNLEERMRRFSNELALAVTKHLSEAATEGGFISLCSIVTSRPSSANLEIRG